ncbi:hypothetical protein GCM10028791_35610 [Echinicola sediminis]
MSAKDPILTPELIKIMKIFLLASVAIVLLLSVFNEYRADNSGGDRDSRVTASSRLYFKNVRQFYYDHEKPENSQLDIYRLDKRLKDNNLIFINLSIIINRIKDKAYLYVEPSPMLEFLDRIHIRWNDKVANSVGQLVFRSGDRHEHINFVKQLLPYIREGVVFEVQTENQWEPILVSEKERQAFKVTAEDYFRLVE